MAARLLALRKFLSRSITQRKLGGRMGVGQARGYLQFRFCPWTASAWSQHSLKIASVADGGVFGRNALRVRPFKSNQNTPTDPNQAQPQPTPTHTFCPGRSATI